MSGYSLDDIQFQPPSKKPAQTSNLSLDKAFQDAAPKQGMNKVASNTDGVKGAVQVLAPMAAVAATAPFTAGMSLPMIYGTEALASLGTEGLLQATGISEPSVGQLATSAVAPGAGRVLASGLAQIPRVLPGFGYAARAAQVPMAREIPGELLPGPASKPLYDEVAAGNLREVLPEWPRLAETVKSLGHDVASIPWTKLQQDLQGTGLEALFGQISQTIKGTPAKIVKQKPTVSGKQESIPTGLPSQQVQVGEARQPGLTFEEADASIKGFNRVISRVSDDTLRRDYIELKKAMLDDLANMPVPESVPLNTWREARAAYKQEKNRMLLSEQLEKSITNKEGVEIFNADKVLKWLRTDEDFKSRVSKPELQALEARFKDMARAEGPIMGRLMGIIAGTAIGGGAGGALAGYVAAEQFSQLLMSQPGRKLVGKMIQNPNASYFRKAGAVAGAMLGGAFDDQPRKFGSGQLLPAPEGK